MCAHFLDFSAAFFAVCAFIMVMIVGSLKLRRTKGVSDDKRVEADGQLIARARNDPEVFVQLYRRHYDAIFRYCAHRLFERSVAEDVTSQVFLKVVENIDAFRGNEQQFRNWLYKITTNAVNHHLRKCARRDSFLEYARDHTKTPADDDQMSSERLALLKEAMLTLKPRYQAIITLRFFENLKMTEIAEVLGSSPGTIRSQMARALAQLRVRCAPARWEI